MENTPSQNMPRSLPARFGLFVLRVFVGLAFWVCLPMAVVFIMLAFFTTVPGTVHPVWTAPNWKWLLPGGVCALLTAGAIFVWRRLPSTGRGWLVPWGERVAGSPVLTMFTAVAVPFYTLCVFANAFLHPHSQRWYILFYWLYGSYLALAGVRTLWRERRGKK